MYYRGYNTGIPRHKYSGDSSDEHNPDFIGSEENGLERKCSSIRSARNMKTNWSVGRRLAKLAKGLYYYLFPQNTNIFTNVTQKQMFLEKILLDFIFI